MLGAGPYCTWSPRIFHVRSYNQRDINPGPVHLVYLTIFELRAPDQKTIAPGVRPQEPATIGLHAFKQRFMKSHARLRRHSSRFEH